MLRVFLGRKHRWDLVAGFPANGSSHGLHLDLGVLTFQLHVKDLNETIRYMHKHRKYQKVTHIWVPVGEGCEGGSGSRAHCSVASLLTRGGCVSRRGCRSLGLVSQGEPFLILGLQLVDQNQQGSCYNDECGSPPPEFDSETWGGAVPRWH